MGAVRLVLLLMLTSTSVLSDDTLRAALEAVQRRQRHLSTPPLLYSRPYQYGDGQPEDIGYGYQKSPAGNSAGVFEELPVPSSQLGTHGYDERPDVKALEKLMLDYLEDQDDSDVVVYPPGVKMNVPWEGYPRTYESDESYNPENPVFIPSPFRERNTETRKARLQGPHVMGRNYASLSRGPDDRFEDTDDNEEYLNVLNSVWEKYKGDEDPEALSESDVEELIDYLGSKEDKKRQYGSYSAGYDFFNSPLPWTKRAPKKELFRQDYNDIGRIVMENPYTVYHKRNALQDVAFDDRYPYRSMQKRFPITKRSPSMHAGPAVHVLAKQRKKKSSEPTQTETDPKVAEEINNIFSTEKKVSNKTETIKKTTNGKNSSGSGERELGSDNTLMKPLEVKKKSIDWSEFFGIDRRKKKSANDVNDEWLLNAYLNAYGINRQQGGEGADNYLEPVVHESQKKRPDDMDAKLRGMEDLIVDQAIKYTGAHEGITDSKEVQAVKDRVMAQLAAAYSLEKMRRAIGEFKSSIAAQQSTAPQSHSIPSPTEKQDSKFKRIAVKKEKAYTPNEGKSDNKLNMEMSNSVKSELERDYEKEGSLECPALDDIEILCRQVGDKDEILLSLCTLDQMCYLCGGRGCDVRLDAAARSLCRGDPGCVITARRIQQAATGPAQQGFTAGCHQACLRYLSTISRRP